MRRIIVIVILAVALWPVYSFGEDKWEYNFYIGYRHFTEQKTWQDSFYGQLNFLKFHTCHFLTGFDIGGSWFKAETEKTYYGGFYMDAGFPLVFRIFPKRFKTDLFISPGVYYTDIKIDHSVGARLNTGITMRYFINRTNSIGISVFSTVDTDKGGSINAGLTYGF